MRPSLKHLAGSLALALIVAAALVLAAGPALASGVGSRVYVVERATGSLAVYDLSTNTLLPDRITGLGNLRHATMIFTPDLHWGFLATRNGQVTRINLETSKAEGKVFTSENSIDNAISSDGRYIATAEYAPGGVTILDAQSMKVVKRIAGKGEVGGHVIESRATGMVDAPGNRFVCVLMESSEVLVIDANRAGFPIVERIKLDHAMPYDAMITPDSRHYLVGHLGVDKVSIVDLKHPKKAARSITLSDPDQKLDHESPHKLPHMAAWAVARGQAFVPLVGVAKLAVLDANTWARRRTLDVRGHPVYAVASPTGDEIWVSFTGPDDDAYIQIIDAARLTVKKEIRVGKRIYHLDFTPRGSHVLVSANGDDQLVLIDARTYEVEDRQTVASPSGVFGPWRAFRIGL